MVAYIKSDLEFILAQIKISEDHARYVADPTDPLGKPLFGTGQAGQTASIPTYNLAWGLRTVDGTYNVRISVQGRTPSGCPFVRIGFESIHVS